jgi:hypothetical protein
MPRKPSLHNVERQALAKALVKRFPKHVVAKMIGMDLAGLTHLLRYEFKSTLPSEASIRLGQALGAIFEASIEAGQRAMAQALREAADALDRGAVPIADRDL